MRCFKKYLKYILLCSLSLVLIACLVGCKNSDNEELTDDTQSVENEINVIMTANLGDYTVVYPQDADKSVIDASKSLVSEIERSYGVQLELKSDYYVEGIAQYSMSDFEILVGVTNRAETTEFISDMRLLDYGYGLVGKKLVVAGWDNDTTAKAVQVFCTKIVSDGSAAEEIFFSAENKFIKVGKYEVDTALLCNRTIEDYTIVYAKDNKNFEKKMAEKLQTHISEICGYMLSVVSSDLAVDGEAQIVVGSLPSSIAADTNGYVLGADGDKVYASGVDSVGNAAAVNALIDQFVAVNGEVNLKLDTPNVTKFDNTTMSSMSYNVWYGGIETESKERVVRQIIDNLPDTFGVQEAVPQWMRYLESELEGYYVCVGEGRDGGNFGEYNAIFYAKDKFNLIESGTKWYSDTPDEPSRLSGVTGVARRIYTYALLERKSDGAQLMHINTHLGLDSNEQARQANLLLDFINSHGNVPIICTGDFNVEYGSTVHTQMKSGILADSYDVAVTAEKSETFHNYGASDKIIDFCFVSKSKIEVSLYHVCNNKVMGGYSSDHHPVYIEYKLVG